MSQQHPAHGSGSRASEKMTAVVENPSVTPTDHAEGRLWLRIPGNIWNEYEPGSQRFTTPTLKVPLQRRRKPAPIKTENDATATIHETSPRQPKQCKVKVTRFQYGGPKNAQYGQHMHEITLLAPCLQQTCRNCWRYHGHLLHSPAVMDTGFSHEAFTERPEALLLSPAVDPQIWSDVWQNRQSRRNSINSTSSLALSVEGPTTSILTPVDEAFKYQENLNDLAGFPTADNPNAVSAPKYRIFLPTTLLRHTVNHAPIKTHWRSTPRQRHTVRLKFSSQRGIAVLTNLMHQRAKRKYSALGRATEQGIRATSSASKVTSDAMARRKCRRRQRIKLIFESKKGKESYRQLVKKYVR